MWCITRSASKRPSAWSSSGESSSKPVIEIMALFLMLAAEEPAFSGGDRGGIR
jgi:hypothetical protein